MRNPSRVLCFGELPKIEEALGLTRKQQGVIDRWE